MPPPSPSTTPAAADNPVVVIGAGLAGLSAAAALTTAGLHPLVLEASPLIGGRVRSVSLPSPSPSSAPPADLGATWFHGTVSNAAYLLATEAGLIPSSSTMSSDDISTSISSDENPAWFRDVLELPAAIVTSSTVSPVRHLPPCPDALRAAALYDDVVLNGPPPRPQSIQNLLKTRLGPPASLREASTRRARDLVENSNNGGPCAKVCALRMHDYQHLDGPDLPAGPAGMVALANVLASRVAKEAVRVGVEVTCIRWKDDVVKVETSTGECLNAGAVIWTPSVTVLKMGVRNDMFDPPLPTWKTEALQWRDMDAVEKVYVVLKQPLHMCEDHAMAVLWENEDMLKDAEVQEEREEDGWERGVNYLSFDHARQAVVFWLTGMPGRVYGALDEEVRLVETERMLNRLLPPGICPGVMDDTGNMDNKRKVEVAAVVCGGWWHNRFVRGGYSYGAVVGDGSRGDCEEARTAVDRLSRPCGRVCFAGEATHAQFYSTMHGAIETGRREASRVVEMVGKDMSTRGSDLA